MNRGVPLCWASARSWVLGAVWPSIFYILHSTFYILLVHLPQHLRLHVHEYTDKDIATTVRFTCGWSSHIAFSCLPQQHGQTNVHTEILRQKRTKRRKSGRDGTKRKRRYGRKREERPKRQKEETDTKSQIMSCLVSFQVLRYVLLDVCLCVLFECDSNKYGENYGDNKLL